MDSDNQGKNAKPYMETQTRCNVRFARRVVTQGHVTVPTEVRSVLDLHAGDVVEFEIVGIIRRQGARAQLPSPTLNLTVVTE